MLVAPLAQDALDAFRRLLVGVVVYVDRVDCPERRKLE
jgi:hypothetical protein